MAEQKKARKRGKPKRTYVHRPNAVCITIHSMDGSQVPREVLEAAADSIMDIAMQHNCLINLAEV